jgi:hypothetical protein
MIPARCRHTNDIESTTRSMKDTDDRTSTYQADSLSLIGAIA